MIETSKLPATALIDTGVFFRFLGDRPDDRDARICADFCQAMIDEGKTLYVAAPTIAEVTRHQGKRVPHTRGIIVVPFDDRAAEILGLQMPMARIHEVAEQSGLSRTYLKYDAMIAACAVRANTKTLVALDSDHTALVRSLGIAVVHPKQYWQPGLFDSLRHAQKDVAKASESQPPPPSEGG